MEEIVKAFEAKKAEFEADRFWGDYYEDYLMQMKWIKPKRIKDHEKYEIEEVGSWYEDEIISNIFSDLIQQIPDVDKKNARTYIIDHFENLEIPDKMLEKIALFLLFNVERQKDGTVSEIVFQDYALNIYNGSKYFYRDFEDVIQYVLIVKYDKIWEYAMRNISKSIGEILEELLEAKYMYFDDLETHYWIGETIMESEKCILGCNHMG